MHPLELNRWASADFGLQRRSRQFWTAPIGMAWDVFGTGRTVLRAGGGILYEQLSLDVFNGIGNSFGLRTAPTGATLVYTNSANATVVQPGNGTIGVINTAFANTPIIRGYTSTTAAPTGPPNAGSIPSQWAQNSATHPLYAFQAFCGDGHTAVPTGPLAGFTPQQCNVMGVDPDFRTPYVTDFSLDLQEAITHSVSLDIGYVGNHGIKLISALDINQPSCAAALVNPELRLRPELCWARLTSAILSACAINPAACTSSTTNETLVATVRGSVPVLEIRGRVWKQRHLQLQQLAGRADNAELSWTVANRWLYLLQGLGRCFGPGNRRRQLHSDQQLWKSS